ncbi:hypothetical protein TRIUR3_30431 [Triticum urartu]|uniref:Uncharacterized protein n=2 Tax=Triticum TaxID=4564 RepID=A0A9R0Q873_TRITD|nr:hypothetical protein TRIUR3_30431 [Triticum urartu]VAH06715.1 unnamed protein product [Triticum turgidum subsp. durum]
MCGGAVIADFVPAGARRPDGSSADVPGSILAGGEVKEKPLAPGRKTAYPAGGTESLRERMSGLEAFLGLEDDDVEAWGAVDLILD